MKTVTVGLDKRRYNIHIGENLLEKAGDFLPPGLSSNCLLVTDEYVDGHYGAQVKEILAGLGFNVSKEVVPPGESAKCLAMAARLYNRAFDHGLGRRSPIFALGGGVVGDLAGFVAATYMRGVPFIQLPTTLLAQVDSSVGGKVAINHPRGKNIIGAFYQPKAVIADISLLKTLPERELQAGMAEVIKYGVIRDEDFFQYLEENLEQAMALDTQVLGNMVARCCEIKARVVEKDEREAGLRAILNFGHTVGHAIEALGNYRLKNHGEAVAVGMAMEAGLANVLGMFADEELQRLRKLLQRVSLDIQPPEEWRRREAIELMQQDKKAVQKEIYFVLPRTIGEVVIENISAAKLEQLLPE